MRILVGRDGGESVVSNKRDKARRQYGENGDSARHKKDCFLARKDTHKQVQYMIKSLAKSIIKTYKQYGQGTCALLNAGDPDMF